MCFLTALNILFQISFILSLKLFCKCHSLLHILFFLTTTLYACCSLVTKLCLTLCDPMDCSLPGSYVHGISQVRILEWVAISYSRGSPWSKDQTHVSCLTNIFFTKAAPEKPLVYGIGLLKLLNPRYQGLLFFSCSLRFTSCLPLIIFQLQ